MTTTRDPNGHPDEMTTAAYLEARLPERAREKFEVHLSRCEACRDGLLLLQDLEETPVPDELVERARGGRTMLAAPSNRRWIPWVAAAAVLAAGFLILLPGLSPSSEPTIPESPVYRDVELGPLEPLTPQAGAVMARRDLTFAWQRIPDVEHYVVRVWGVDSDFLLEFETEAEQSSAGWPDDAPAPPIGALIWKVRAVSLHRTIGESRPTPFEVTR